MPDTGPKLAFEALVAQMVDRADDVMEAHERLRHLMRVNNDLTSNLDLPTLLRRIAEIAVELLHAKYGAMGVIGPDGSLEQFIHTGMDDDAAVLIGHLPEGHGLLGASMSSVRPVRVASIGHDARSGGFPANHPPMTSFLGVPIRVRDEVYGSLYVTEHIDGAFSADDEELAMGLAATAGIAIANARLFADAVYRERWASALAGTARRLVSDDSDQHLDDLITQVMDLTDADLVSIGMLTPTGDVVQVDRAVGLGAGSLAAISYDRAGSLADEALRTGLPLLVEDASRHDDHGFTEQGKLEHALLVPFDVHHTPSGVVCLARVAGSPAFTARDIELVTSFASHITVSVERGEALETRRRMALIEDRARIARDLHDHVIQRLFATALNLEVAAAAVDPTVTPARIRAQIAQIDGAITQIRQSIFSLSHQGDTTAVSLRARILEIVDRLQVDLADRPQVMFLGPVDLMADADLTDDVSAVVNEGLANVIRHADARAIEVSVSAADGQVSVVVLDDGDGPGDSPRLSGLANLRRRAESRGGTFEITAVESGGTRVEWTVPV